MNNLTKEDIKKIHERIQQRFKTTAGINDEGLIDSMAQRPNQVLYGKEVFPDIYSKAASLMEAAMRWHAFTDGNKRTGLLATEQYLKINGCFCLYPVHAVRFSVVVASTQGEQQVTTNNLVRKIADWLRNYVGDHNDKRRVQEIKVNFFNEIIYMKSLFDRDPVKALNLFNEWLAVDIYPEYKKEMDQVLEFLEEMYAKSFDYKGKSPSNR